MTTSDLYRNIIIFVLIFIFLGLSRNLIKSLVAKLFVKLSSKKNMDIRLLKFLIDPSVFLILFSFVYASYLILLHNYYAKVDFIILKIVQIVEVLAVFWFVINLVGGLATYFSNHKNIRDKSILANSILVFIFKIIRILVIILTGIFILNILGINVLALAAGVGLVGIAVALAAQDTLKNFFASLIILLDQLFIEGDYIKIDNIEGYIKHIGFRSTVVVTNNQEVASIPNTKFTDSIVRNVSKIPLRGMSIKLIIQRSKDKIIIDKIITDIKSFVSSHPFLINDQCCINLHSIRNGTLEFLCYFLTDKNTDYEITLLLEEIVDKLSAIVKSNEVELFAIMPV